MLLQILCSASCCVDFVAECLKTLCHTDSLRLIGILYRHNHLLVFRKLYTCSKECFVQCLIECLCDTQTLTGRFHLRSKADLCPTQFLKGEYRHLDCDIVCNRCKSRLIAQTADRVTDDHLGCQIYDRNTGNLTDVRHGS